MMASVNWFESWFDSPLYYELYASRNEADATMLLETVVPFLPAPGGRLLDLACGRGRHALNLARLGYQVTGVDLSASALAHAKENAAAAGLNIHFLRGDMRNPLPGPNDAIVNFFTSFGYFDSDLENGLVLKQIANALEPGGRFIIDYLNPEPLKRNLVTSEEGRYSAGTYRIRRKIEGGSVLKEITMIPDATKETSVFTESVLLLSSRWFEEQTAAVGLSLLTVLGDYTGARFNEEHSPRFIGIFQADRSAKSSLTT